MPAAERRRRGRCRSPSPPLVLGALALRLWGFRQGLPLVYNADENAHFVAGAIGMFGHTYNPNYFINPPAYTYLLHGGVRARLRRARRRLGGVRDRPGRRLRRRPRAVGRARRGRRRLPGVGGGAAVRPPRRPRRRGAARGRLPARALRPLRAQRRPDAGAACASRWSASPASSPAGGSATTRSPAPASGSPARPSTPAASCCCRCWRRPLVGPGQTDAAAGRRDRARGRARAGVLPDRQPVRAARLRLVPRRAAASSRRRRATAAASSA